MRDCGECKVCCKLPAVDDLKESYEWCRHCIPKGGSEGCAIYEERPEMCRVFRCVWLTCEEVPEWFRPDRSGIMVNTKKIDGKQFLLAWEAKPGAFHRKRNQRVLAQLHRDNGYPIRRLYERTVRRVGSA